MLVVARMLLYRVELGSIVLSGTGYSFMSVEYAGTFLMNAVLFVCVVDSLVLLGYKYT